MIDTATLLTVFDRLQYGAILFTGDQELGRNEHAATLGPAAALRPNLAHGHPTTVTLPDGRQFRAVLVPVSSEPLLDLLVLMPPWADPEEVQRLRTLNTEMEVIFNSSYDELFITDGQGKTLRASAAAERHYGLKPSELEGRSVYELEAEGIFTPSATIRAIKEHRRVTLMQETRNGRRLMVTANPVFDEQGNLIRVISNSRDLTEVLLLKEQLDEAERLMARYSQELETLRKEQLKIPGLVAESPAMRYVVDLASRVAAFDTTVLILGESGVGKNVIARTIHRLSHRRDGPFIEVNCGAIPEPLLESELFGYERGAFTGARKEGKLGMFELAHQGTLFLNEVAELPLSMQVKLLHAIQDRTITPLGGSRPRQIDVRIIAATNRDIAVMVQSGQFREDLYYRLNVVEIPIPPLRERREDILPLLKNALARFNTRYGLEKTFSPGVLQRLLEHDWPGNVRELENLVERLVVTSAGPEIGLEDLPPRLAAPAPQATDRIIPLRQALAEVEEGLYRLAWEKTRSSYKVAELLGVSQSTAYRRLRRYLKSNWNE